MSKIGKFMKKNMQDQRIELFVGEHREWVAYSEWNAISHIIVVGTFKDYDEDSGIITMVADTGHTFYISDEKIEMFWKADSGFDLILSSTATVKTSKGNKNRDIM